MKILGILGVFLIRLFNLFFLVLLIFLSVCFLTLLERKVLGYVQNRKGPVKVLVFGMFQPILDGGKLLLKRTGSGKLYYYVLPFFSIVLIRIISLGVVFYSRVVVIRNGVFYVLIFRTLVVYILFFLGWWRENVYGVLGGLRRSSQIISYEVVMFFLLLLVVIFYFSFNFSIWSFSSFYLLDLFLIWVVVVLVETNRRPYDFAEGERELVSGFNVEYSGVFFALMFISEYGMLIFFRWLTSVIFLNRYFFWVFIFMFIFVRGFVPRRRYDILISVCWKFFFMLLRFLMFKFF